MSTGLYEELGISKDASPEEVRKAYKKKALLTHPDRLPPGATAAEKSEAEENFRRVNNAYEVLHDPKKRCEYDIHGVWPPPEQTVPPMSHTANGSHFRSYGQGRRPSRSQTFPDPFFSHHHDPFHAFQFSDPFVLFNSIFEDTPFSSHRRYHSYSRSTDPFEHLYQLQNEIEDFINALDRDPFVGMRSGIGRSGFMSPLSMFPMFPAIESSHFSDGRGHFSSESYTASTVNGVTRTTHKRIDSEGNEHITRTLPDGRRIRTINGVEQQQQPRGHVSYTDTSKMRSPDPSANRYLTAPPPRSRTMQVASTSRMDYGNPHPPPYPGPPPVIPSYRAPTPQANSHRRSRRASEKYNYSSNPTPPTDPDHDMQDRGVQDERHHKKWWSRGH